LSQARRLKRYRYLIGFALAHLLLILTVCLRDTFATFALAPTILPTALTPFWNGAAAAASFVLGEDLRLRNPARNVVTFYLNVAGIEAGYGFFSPNVPSNYKLVFELHYADSHTEYELPHVADAATAFRLESLLDRIAEVSYEPMRQTMFQMLTYPVWQRHPDAISVRAVLGYVIWPSPEQFQRGEKDTFEPVYAYDFDLRPSVPAAARP
jgi:hypothetical protein